MTTTQTETIPTPGTAMGGGFYAGQINIDGQLFALIVAPKAEGDHDDAPWIHDDKDVPNALSWNDGRANTAAMADAGSELAKWALGLNIGGETDWYLPSQDELEIVYRNLKPTAIQNYLWARSGINVSAIPPTRPYTANLPAQTAAQAFQAGGGEAFKDEAYWTSTQHASYSACAWFQNFDDGGQGNYKGAELRARAVRRLPL